MLDKRLHFCTLFDSNYLTRGLALYQSLEKHCPNFTLYIIAFDEQCYKILNELKLPNMVVISLSEFEDDELLVVKPTRTRQEYYWTCASSSILYCIKRYNLDMCIYIDADLLFLDNPQILIDEMENKSLMISEHGMKEESKKTEVAGKYCVQFMPFKNDDNGMKALRWWVDQCIKWCFARLEDGKFGDQKYLDDWPTRFKGVHVLKHAGGAVAPWNVYKYNFTIKEGKFFVEEKDGGKKVPLIFYHFHSTKICFIINGIKTFYSTYTFEDKKLKNLYNQYGKLIEEAFKLIRGVDQQFELGFDDPKEYWEFIFKSVIDKLKRVIKGPIKYILQKKQKLLV